MKEAILAVILGSIALALQVDDIRNEVQQKRLWIRAPRSMTLFTVAVLWSVYKWVTEARRLKSQETLCRDPTSLKIFSELTDKILGEGQEDNREDCEYNSDSPSMTWQRATLMESIVTIRGASDPKDLVKSFQPDTIVPDKVLRKRFEIASHKAADEVVSQLAASMQIAYSLDHNCTLQVGAFAILNHSGTGRLRKWTLEGRTPTITSISRSPWGLLHFLYDRPVKWTIRGFNLEGAILKATTGERTQTLRAVDLENNNELVIEEPRMIQNLATSFRDSMFICASRSETVEEGVCFTIESEATPVNKAYWVSVVDGLIPGPSTVITLTSFSLLTGIVQAICERHHLFSKVPLSGLGLQDGQASTFADFNLEGISGLLKLPWSEVFSLVWGHSWIWLELLAKCYLVYVLVNIWILAVWLRFRRNIISRDPIPEGLIQVNDRVWELYTPNGTPEMDIVFFHGLPVGNIEDSFWRTWLAKDDEAVVWPKDWLSKKLPKARIFSVAHTSGLHHRDSSDFPDMYVLSEDLVHNVLLDENLNIGQNCPLILVGHCLGGIIIKSFLSSAIFRIHLAVPGSRQFEQIRRGLHNIKGAFFYATPSGRSEEMENLSKLVPNYSCSIGPREFGRLNAEFKRLREKWNVRTSGVAESRPTTASGVNDVIVNEGSARQDLDDFYTHRQADHFTICRARSPEDPTVIKRLTRFIERCLHDHA